MFVKHSYILCIVIVFISSVDVIAQITPTKSPPVICDEYSELEEKNKNYVIEVSPTNLMTPPSYGHKETVVVCDFNNTLRLRKKDGGIVPNVKWVKGGVPTSNPLVATTSAANFTGGLNTIVVEIEGEKDLIVFLRIIQDIVVDEDKTNDLADYSFDGNGFPGYPAASRQSGIKFLEIDKSDEVVLEVNPNINASNHVLIEPTVPFIPADIEIQPSQILSGSKGTVTHSVKHLNNSHFKVHSINGCSSKIYEIETYSPKTLSIDMYVLKESDDDIANYCPTDPSYQIGCTIKITDPNHSCIDPGPDGSIDLYFNKSYWEDKSHVNDSNRPPDIYNGNPMFPHLARINPSPDPSSPGHFYCNKKPRASNNATSPSVTNNDRATIEGYMNQIYSQIGITVDINLLPEKLVNFDSRLEDNKLSTLELSDYNTSVWGDDGEAQELQLYLVDKYFPDYIKGVGLPELNTAAVNYSLATIHTYPHEIGHARYDLYHPDGTEMSNGDPDVGWEKDRLKFPAPGDDRNFMRSGQSGLSSLNFYKFIVRQYQWEKIHANH